jgi:hypothetical protein
MSAVMKNAFLLLLTLTLTLVLAGCSPILERKYVASERVDAQLYANGVTYIEVSGLCAVPEMGVAVASMERIGDDIYIKIKLGWLADGCQPRLLERVPVLTGNERIYFGREKVQIWPRPSEPLPPVISDMKEVKVVRGPGK